MSVTARVERFDLTALPAERVAPPPVAECFANLECQVVDVRLVKPYDLFVLEVLKAWVDPAQKNTPENHSPSRIWQVRRRRYDVKLASG
jgi:flavin reductase (DIM6/NTAB) family NADH-FMN oxidoreductase RutF